MQCLLVLEADEDDHKQNGLLAVHSEEEKKKSRESKPKKQYSIQLRHTLLKGRGENHQIFLLLLSLLPSKAKAWQDEERPHRA